LTFVDDLLHQVVAGEIESSTVWVIQLSRRIVQILITHHEIAKQVFEIC
jgi:hypothetical protein